MQLTNEQVQVAVAAGLAMTDPDSNAVVPMKHASGAIILRQLLLSVAQGQVSFAPVVQQEQPPIDGLDEARKKAIKKK